MNRVVFYRAFSLPLGFYKSHFRDEVTDLEWQGLLEVFDNNRYASRSRVRIIRDECFLSGELFGKMVRVNLAAIVHCSDNVSILAEVESHDAFTAQEYARIRDNWIPREAIFSVDGVALNSREVLNLGLYRLLQKVTPASRAAHPAPISFYRQFIEAARQARDPDIRFIEKVYEAFDLNLGNGFKVPTMYGAALFVSQEDEAASEQVLNIPSVQYGRECVLSSGERCIVERNFAIVLLTRNQTAFESLSYLFAFMNLLKHLRNRVGGEVSQMLDADLHKDQPSRFDCLEDGRRLRKYFSVNFDEFNNVNIWHSAPLLELAKYVFSDEGWGLQADIDGTRVKLEEYMAFLNTVSSEKIGLLMDSVTIIVGFLGVFSFFELIQVLASEPFEAWTAWYVAFLIILVLTPAVLLVLGRYSKSMLRFLERFV